MLKIAKGIFAAGGVVHLIALCCLSVLFAAALTAARALAVIYAAALCETLVGQDDAMYMWALALAGFLTACIALPYVCVALSRRVSRLYTHRRALTLYRRHDGLLPPSVLWSLATRERMLDVLCSSLPRTMFVVTAVVLMLGGHLVLGAVALCTVPLCVITAIWSVWSCRHSTVLHAATGLLRWVSPLVIACIGGRLGIAWQVVVTVAIYQAVLCADACGLCASVARVWRQACAVRHTLCRQCAD